MPSDYKLNRTSTIMREWVRATPAMEMVMLEGHRSPSVAEKGWDTRFAWKGPLKD